MSIKLSEAAAYGYVSVLIAKSPSIDVLIDMVEHREHLDIQQAVAKGLLSSDYLRLTRYKDIENIDDGITQFYIEFFIDLIKYLPDVYGRYIEVFMEIFDIDKVIALLLSSREHVKKPRYMYTKLIQLDTILVGKSFEKIEYGLCTKSESIIECIYDKYIQRLLQILSNLSRLPLVNLQLIDIELCKNSLYLFTLLRLYSYILNKHKLKIKNSISIEELIKKHIMSNWVTERLAKSLSLIEKELFKDPSLVIAYEAKAVNMEIKELLLYTATLLNKLTYLAITKFYESMLLRFIVMRRLFSDIYEFR